MTAVAGLWPAEAAALVERMDYTQFADLPAARQWQHLYGGHLFVDNDDSAVLWFNRRYTISDIVGDPRWIRGLSGVFNPSEES